MIIISEDFQNELDKLVNIAQKNGNGQISQSLLWDVIYKQYKQKPSAEEITAIHEYFIQNNVNIIKEDDIEDYDSDSIPNIKPYDTNLIDISPKPLTLDAIVSRLKYNEIDLMPDFQRKAGLWSTEQKSRLIESLLLRIPLPAFYFDGSDNGNWIVIDGLQRLTALKEYFVEPDAQKKLKLVGLEFLKDLEGSCVDDLPRVYSRRMMETQIIAYIINPGAPIRLKYNIFKRINTGGLELEPQEIRHALYQGKSTQLLKRLADLEIFKKATGYSISTERMLDREFVLRYIAFSELTIEKYKDSIDDFLNCAMEYINNNSKPDFDNGIENTFTMVLNASLKIFGQFAFRRMPDQSKKRPISKALFETWTAILSKYNEADLNILIERKEILCNKYIAMYKDAEFVSAISGGKSSAVRKRYDKINNLVYEVLKNDK